MQWENLPDNVDDWFGFVYLITQINAAADQPQFYIGCKQFHSKVRRAPLKGKKRRRLSTKHSDYDDYYGSSAELQKAVELHGKDNFRRQILHLTTCKWETKYKEAVEQIQRNVLMDDRYYNGMLNLRIGKCPKALKDKYKSVIV